MPELRNVYVVTVCGEHDITGEGKASAARHVQDLRKLGCEDIRVRWFATWQEADAFEDKLRG